MQMPSKHSKKSWGKQMENIRLNQATEYSKQEREKHFPWLSALLYIALMLITPFISSYGMYIALIVLLYRLVIYKESVTYIDLAFMIPFSSFFRIPGGDALLIYYVLLMDIILLFRRKRHCLNVTLILVLIITLFLFLRMGSKITTIVFIVGGLALLYLTFADGKIDFSTKTLSSFVSGTVLSTMYAYVFRDSSRVLAYTYDIETVHDNRFRGLFADPNYFSTFLVLAIVAIMILYKNHKVRPLKFYLCFAFLGFSGAITLSKSFFLMFAFILVFYVISWFNQKKYLKGIVGALICTCFLLFVFQGKIPIFNEVLLRFVEADNLNDMTTGRTGLWGIYLEYIRANTTVLFIGDGLDKVLSVGGTHNLFIEIVYNIGLFGLFLFASFFVSIMMTIRRRYRTTIHMPLIRLLPIICIFTLYFFLQGFATTIFYLSLFIVFLCYIESIKLSNTELTDKEEI